MDSIKKLFTVTLGVSILSLVSCGGGGNDGTTDDNDRNVSGTWTGALTKTIDTCSSNLPQTLSFNHLVAQNISAVQLNEGGLEYLGNLVGDDGFSVDANQTVSGGTCQDARRVEYDSIVDDTDSTSEAILSITRTCGSEAACNIQYTGTASRNIPSGSNTPQPTSTPGGPVTLTGGCVDMNPNTVAGTYSGDGGCGISDAKLRKDTQGAESVIILEPFGGNGSTSFVINPTTTSTALSRRSDLTVRGVSGYTCSLTCSPPGTFTTSCTKEGGTSCIEKF